MPKSNKYERARRFFAGFQRSDESLCPVAALATVAAHWAGRQVSIDTLIEVASKSRFRIAGPPRDPTVNVRSWPLPKPIPQSTKVYKALVEQPTPYERRQAPGTNCSMLPLPDGCWMLVVSGLSEASTWLQDGNHPAWCLFGPDLPYSTIAAA